MPQVGSAAAQAHGMGGLRVRRRGRALGAGQCGDAQPVLNPRVAGRCAEFPSPPGTSDVELHNFSFFHMFWPKQVPNGGSSSVHSPGVFGCGDEFSQGQITNIPSDHPQWWGGGAPGAIYALVCFGGEALTWVLHLGIVVETQD